MSTPHLAIEYISQTRPRWIHSICCWCYTLANDGGRRWPVAFHAITQRTTNVALVFNKNMPTRQYRPPPIIRWDHRQKSTFSCLQWKRGAQTRKVTRAAFGLSLACGGPTTESARLIIRHPPTLPPFIYFQPFFNLNFLQIHTSNWEDYPVDLIWMSKLWNM